MSLLVDDRAGSSELAKYLPPDLVVMGRLDFGDVMFGGNGPDGDVVIGVEHKTLADVLKCIDDGRFSGTQLPGMMKTYDYSYLIVEGIWRTDPESGVIQVRRGKTWTSVSYGKRASTGRELYAWLNTITTVSGVSAYLTSTKTESATVVMSLYRWWGKQWREHTAHLQPDKSGRSGSRQREITFTRPTLVRLIAMDLPGIGWGRSEAVEKAFPSVSTMVKASVKDWMSIEGIGKTTAERVVQALNGEGAE